MEMQLEPLKSCFAKGLYNLQPRGGMIHNSGTAVGRLCENRRVRARKVRSLRAPIARREEDSYDWRASVGGGSGGGGAHLRRDEAGIDARAGQGSVHLVVTHHGKRAGVRAGDGQRGPQRRGGWRAARKHTVSFTSISLLIHF